MVRVQTILTTTFVVAILANAPTDAGEATKERKRNVVARAAAHTEKLKPYGQALQSKFGSMSKGDVKELKYINDVILDRILRSDQFLEYLKNVFSTLGTYAEEKIVSLVENLEKDYKTWEEENFPDKEEKEKIRKILQNIKLQTRPKDVDKVIKRQFPSLKDIYKRESKLYY